MKNDVKIKLDLSKLKEFEKQLSGNKQVKVGILGNSNRKEGLTNASVGLVHEFGSISKNLPERSFLRMPLQDKLDDKKIKDSGITKDIVENKPNIFLKKLGVLAENIIQDAFNTGGFGKWKSLSPKTVLKKNSERILIDTQQLRKSITSKVVSK